MRPSPYAREEMEGDVQPNVSDGAVLIFCVCLAFFYGGYALAKWHAEKFGRPTAEQCR